MTSVFQAQMRDVEPLRTRSGWIVALGIVYVIAGLIALSSVVTALQAQVSASTRIGELKFESGYPSMETVAKLYDEMDFQRGCQAYLWGLPAVSILEWKRAHDAVFKVRNGQFVSYTTFDEKLGILTPNYTTRTRLLSPISPRADRWRLNSLRACWLA